MKLVILLASLSLFACTKKATLDTDQNQSKNQNESQSAAGSIAEENDMCICTKEYRPVCGSNGQTYGNSCLAGCDDVEYTEGPCEESEEESESQEE